MSSPGFIIGYTGIAMFGYVSVGDWIAQGIGALGLEVALDKIVLALSECGAYLQSIPNREHAKETFVIGGFEGSQSRITLLSNFETIRDGRVERRALAGMRLERSSVRPKSPLVIVTGDGDAVPVGEGDRLRLAMRARVPDSELQAKLADVNMIAHQHSNLISAGCYVASLHATGVGVGQTFFPDDQERDYLPLSNMAAIMGLQVSSVAPDGAPGAVRLVGSFSAYLGSSPGYFREQLRLRPDDPELWNNYGAYLSHRAKWPEALAAYKRALELRPDCALALGNIAVAYWRTGNVLEAEVSYKVTIQVGLL